MCHCWTWLIHCFVMLVRCPPWGNVSATRNSTKSKCLKFSLIKPSIKQQPLVISYSTIGCVKCHFLQILKPNNFKVRSMPQWMRLRMRKKISSRSHERRVEKQKALDWKVLSIRVDFYRFILNTFHSFQHQFFDKLCSILIKNIKNNYPFEWMELIYVIFSLIFYLFSNF